MMLVVDSSVWIANLRGLDTTATAKLAQAIRNHEIIVGDLILLEVLQGARSEDHAGRIERSLRAFPVETMLGPGMAPVVARNDRLLRRRGITVRKTADMIIGTWCIEKGFLLLHDDRDFDPLEVHLGLKSL